MNKTKLILVTGYRQSVSEFELLNSGFRASITKPFKQSQIFDCIVTAISTTSRSLENFDTNPISTDSISIRNKGRILLVEDNNINQMVAKAFLEKMGYSVLTAANGEEALLQLEIADFDLILMDCQMPVMDGFEATKAIRKMNHTTKSQIPIIALTANAMRSDEDKCLRIGMSDYLSKPIRKEVLERKVQQWVPKSELKNPNKEKF